MTHIELIEFIHTHRQTLDDVYKSKKSTTTQELEKAKLITRIGEEVELSESYRNFIDITLNRIDYAVIFNSYTAELQEMLKQKSRYLQEKKPYYLEEILSLLKGIFLKLNKRDQEIRMLLVKIENETSLDLDLLIEKSMDILEKIEEVNRANNEVRKIFYNDIYDIDPKTKSFIDDIASSLLQFVENISESLQRLKQFIARTRKLRLQNRQLHQLATQILEEKDQELEAVLTLEPKNYYLTLYRSQRNRIQSFPDASENSKVIRKLRSQLNEVKVPKEPTKFNISPQKEEKLNLVNIQAIQNELEENGSDDIFNFIYEHQELQKFMESSEQELSRKEESFKIYLQFIIPHNKHIKLNKNYNNHAIRIAQWI